MSKRKLKPRDRKCSECKKEWDPLVLVRLPKSFEKGTNIKARICPDCVKAALERMRDAFDKADREADRSGD